MVGWTNTSGGGLNIQSNKAVIHVTAPVGSTISFEYGGIVVAVLGPKYSFVSAADSLKAEWYYSVSHGNYGLWTIRAQRSIFEKSENIEVDSNKQYDISFSVLENYLYNNGVENILYTSDLINSGGSSTITKESTYIQIYHKALTLGYQYYRVANVDLTAVKTIRYTGQAYVDTSDQGIWCRIFVTDDASITNATDASIKATEDLVATSYIDFTVDLNVNDLSGTFYVACGQDTNKASNWKGNRYLRIKTLSLLTY